MLPALANAAARCLDCPNSVEHFEGISTGLAPTSAGTQSLVIKRANQAFGRNSKIHTLIVTGFHTNV